MARRDLSGAVDFSVLESYAAHDPGVIDEVLQIFREQAAMWSPLLDVSSPGWKDAVHTVKGAAAGIGAKELAEACTVAESGEDGFGVSALSKVRDAMDRALGDVAAYQHERMLQSLRSPA
jgi:hypothetical protein